MIITGNVYGGDVCCTYSNLEENFELLEKSNKNINKDTVLLLSSDTKRVYWLKHLKTHICCGIEQFM